MHDFYTEPGSGTEKPRCDTRAVLSSRTGAEKTPSMMEVRVVCVYAEGRQVMENGAAVLWWCQN